MNSRIKVLHLITGLQRGGAEAMLYKLICNSDRTRFVHVVISLMDEGVYGRDYKSLGIEVHAIGAKAFRDFGRAIRLIRKMTRQISPDILQGWMYHGNLAATLAGWGRKPVRIWNVRHSIDDIRDEKWMTRLVIKAGAQVSRNADAIIYNSCVSRGQHERLGFYADRGLVIPNGFDTQRYKSSEVQASITKRSLDIANDEVVIGMFARYHPMKGHHDFIGAAARVVEALPGAKVKFLLAGRGTDQSNSYLIGLLHEKNLESRFLLLGERSDVDKLLTAVDIMALSSRYGEGFPNIIGEAMATGVACCVTDVGDTRHIVGDAGYVTPPGKMDAFAAALIELILMGGGDRRVMGTKARAKIQNHYEIGLIIEEYEKLYYKWDRCRSEQADV